MYTYIDQSGRESQDTHTHSSPTQLSIQHSADLCLECVATNQLIAEVDQASISSWSTFSVTLAFRGNISGLWLVDRKHTSVRWLALWDGAVTGQRVIHVFLSANILDL